MTNHPTHQSTAFATILAEPLAAALKTASRVKPTFVRLIGSSLLKLIRVASASPDGSMRTLATLATDRVTADFDICVAPAIAQWVGAYEGGTLELEIRSAVSAETGEVEGPTALNVRGAGTKSSYNAIVPQYDAIGAMLLTGETELIGTVELNVIEFERYFPAVAMAASSSANQPMLNVVCLEVNDAMSITLTATDGFRVHRSRACSVADWSGDPVRALVPMQAIALALDARGGETVRIEARENSLRFAYNDEASTTVEVQTITGTYPKVDAVIDPALAGETAVALSVQDVTRSIDRLTKLSKDANVLVSVGAKSVTIENAGDNCGVDTIPTGEAAKGPECRVIVNPKYMRDAAEACGAVATLNITAPNKPISLVGGGLTAVVMPINPKAA